jgi:hypothetical protein
MVLCPIFSGNLPAAMPVLDFDSNLADLLGEDPIEDMDNNPLEQATEAPADHTGLNYE